MIGGVIAVPEKTHRAPNQPNCTKNGERVPPPDERHQRNRHRRSQRAARPCPHPHDAVCPAPLTEREPPGERAGERRKRARLRRSKYKARHEQRIESANHSGQDRKQGPAAYDSDQHPTLSPMVAQPRRGYFEDTVCNVENRKYPGKLNLRKSQVRLHSRRRHREANAIQVCDERAEPDKRQHYIASASGPRSPRDHNAPSAASISKVASNAAIVRSTSSSVCADEVSPPGQAAMSMPCSKHPTRILFTSSRGRPPFSFCQGILPA